MMDNIAIYHNSAKEKVIQDAGKMLSGILLDYKLNSIPVLLLLSGGSALSISDEIENSALNTNLTLGVLDERYSQDPEINNFSQLIQTKFYTRAKKRGCSFIDTRLRPDDSMLGLAQRFQKALMKWREDNKDGKIVITQGFGSDGHTSGVMPFPENVKWFTDNFVNPEIWVRDYDATGKNQYPERVTTTLECLKSVDLSILFVCGREKESVLKKILMPDPELQEERDLELAKFPGRIVHQMKNVMLFTDIENGRDSA